MSHSVFFSAPVCVWIGLFAFPSLNSFSNGFREVPVSPRFLIWKDWHQSFLLSNPLLVARNIWMMMLRHQPLSNRQLEQEKYSEEESNKCQMLLCFFRGVFLKQFCYTSVLSSQISFLGGISCLYKTAIIVERWPETRERNGDWHATEVLGWGCGSSWLAS